MDENKILRLRVLERTEETIDEVVEKQLSSGFAYPNQSNPIYKNLAKFHNEPIGKKFSVKDLFGI
ncbi:MAG TPA: hypothetical protein PLG15_04330 [Candidatus Gastranaerophilaceae bacterium]|nr:hypothetical protein [Candidatus Gastranaerophilaceae bacterium]HPT41594.1 hypothetical protein [Candidatus Gastranaerophilaceae bacterium]